LNWSSQRKSKRAVAGADALTQEAGSAAGATGNATREQGMAEMSKKFIDMGAQVYVDKAEAVKASNKALR
jgi:phosphomethylpyrimidine synthase